MALSAMSDMDFGGGGKFIFDTCKVKPSPVFNEQTGDAQVLLSLCLRIGSYYLRPYTVEIKKN